MFGLYQPYDKSFFQLMDYILFTIQEYVLDYLHGNSASSTGKTMDFQVMDKCLTHGIKQETVVIEKCVVFTLHHRHLHFGLLPENGGIGKVMATDKVLDRSIKDKEHGWCCVYFLNRPIRVLIFMAHLGGYLLFNRFSLIEIQYLGSE